MIIELFGIPGVGKTTYAKNETQFKSFFWPFANINNDTKWFKRNISKFFSSIPFIFLHLIWINKLSKLVKTYLDDKKNINRTIFNGIFLKKTFFKYKKKKNILFDEGVIQIAFSIFWRSTKDFDSKYIDKLFDLFYTPNKVVVINASHSTIVSRLLSRQRKPALFTEDELDDKVAFLLLKKNEFESRFLNSNTYIKEIYTNE